MDYTTWTTDALKAEIKTLDTRINTIAVNGGTRALAQPLIDRAIEAGKVLVEKRNVENDLWSDGFTVGDIISVDLGVGHPVSVGITKVEDDAAPGVLAPACAKQVVEFRYNGVTQRHTYRAMMLLSRMANHVLAENYYRDYFEFEPGLITARCDTCPATETAAAPALRRYGWGLHTNEQFCPKCEAEVV